MASKTMTCAYCNRKLPWNHDYFPSTIYAECWACRALEIDKDECPRCGDKEPATSRPIYKRRFWPSWMPGAWQYGKLEWLWCDKCGLDTAQSDWSKVIATK